MSTKMTDEAPRDRVDRIEQKLDRLVVSVDKRFDEVSDGFIEQRRYTEFAFGRLDTALGRLNTAFGRLDTAFGRLDTAFGRLDTAFERLDTRLTSMDTKLDEVLRLLRR